RRPFFLYVDEFQNLTTRSFSGLLSEARKYGLGLILAHQHLSQIETEVRDAILGNVGAMAVFRLGPSDAPFFERLLPPYADRDLMNQPNYRMVVRMTEAGERLPAFSATTEAPYRQAA
ncbi:MAG: type IV secretory system conjugative DNA transfer family protein, partial [Pseudomonadota bacterium]